MGFSIVGFINNSFMPMMKGLIRLCLLLLCQFRNFDLFFHPSFSWHG
jgi:hypothetical protein